MWCRSATTKPPQTRSIELGEIQAEISEEFYESDIFGVQSGIMKYEFRLLFVLVVGNVLGLVLVTQVDERWLLIRLIKKYFGLLRARGCCLVCGRQ